MNGKKFDSQKVRMDLVDPELVIGIAQVLTYGAQKYGAYNWKEGIKWSRIIGAIKRHLAAIELDEWLDPESGKPHTWHIGCELMFLNHYGAHYLLFGDFDDRQFNVCSPTENLLTMEVEDDGAEKEDN